MATGSLVVFDNLLGAIEPLTQFPGGWSVIDGRPEAQNRKVYTPGDPNMVSGKWSCSPGKFSLNTVVWEFCHVISGKCIITPEGGEPQTLEAGGTFIVEKGFRGTWEVVQTMTKFYVVAP
ncbi:cupin domain-containing protein [Castellaniella sp. GW247-6E4]|uniref:cupin domain-containing protein n=1 Tax=Castellaniella sp. GW247-6E4 TaxID=3140380 RepID=UPI00331535BB